jgi:predicted O-methyltransferase YrrM
VSDLAALLAELEAFGQQNDATITDRPRRMLNITRDTGEFLAVLVKAMRATRVLEIGTSNGYSTLWLAQAARTIGGAVITVEKAELKIGMARETFARSGLAPVLRPGGLLVVDNATSHAEQMAPFVALVAADPTFTTSLVPVGNGEFLAVKGSSTA